MYQNIRKDRLKEGNYDEMGIVMNSSPSLLQTIRYDEYLDGYAIEHEPFFYETKKDYKYEITKQGKAYFILAVCEYTPGGHGIGVDDILLDENADMSLVLRIRMLLEWDEFWDE